MAKVPRNSSLTVLHRPFQPQSLSPTLTPPSAEVNIGIAAACIPTLLPLYRLCRDWLHHSPTNPSSNTTGGKRNRKDSSSQASTWRPQTSENVAGTPWRYPSDTSGGTTSRSGRRYEISKPFHRSEGVGDDDDVEMKAGISREDRAYRPR